MSDGTWIVAAVLWWGVGVAGFVYTWTARYDFTTREIVTAGLSGVLGPFAWLIGWLVVIRKPWAKTILYRRGRRIKTPAKAR